MGGVSKAVETVRVGNASISSTKVATVVVMAIVISSCLSFWQIEREAEGGVVLPSEMQQASASDDDINIQGVASFRASVDTGGNMEIGIQKDITEETRSALSPLDWTSADDVEVMRAEDDQVQPDRSGAMGTEDADMRDQSNLKSSERIAYEKRKAEPNSIMVPFINNHDVPLEVSWVNYQGVEQMFSIVSPKGRVPQNTYLGHRWVMRANDTRELIVDVVIEKKHGGGVYSQNPSEYHQRYYEENGIAYLNPNPRGPMVKWIPEPVHEGHVVRRQVSPSYYTKETGIGSDGVTITVNMITLAMQPRIFLIENFVSADEADAIVDDAIASGSMSRSGVVAPDGSLGSFDDGRTSWNTWMAADRNDIVKGIFKRGFNLMQVPFDISNWTNHSESLQVLRYEESQQYKPHHDTFNVMEKSTPGVIAGHNRYATLFIYLTDVEEGGETVFPRYNDTFVDEACTVADGFKVKPKKGNAALFISMLPDGNTDILSLHGGCPVIKGVKWASNFWFWDPSNAQ